MKSKDTGFAAIKLPRCLVGVTRSVWCLQKIIMHFPRHQMFAKIWQTFSSVIETCKKNIKIRDPFLSGRLYYFNLMIPIVPATHTYTHKIGWYRERKNVEVVSVAALEYGSDIHDLDFQSCMYNISVVEISTFIKSRFADRSVQMYIYLWQPTCPQPQSRFPDLDVHYLECPILDFKQYEILQVSVSKTLVLGKSIVGMTFERYWLWRKCTISYKFSVSVKKIGEGWIGRASDIVRPGEDPSATKDLASNLPHPRVDIRHLIHIKISTTKESHSLQSNAHQNLSHLKIFHEISLPWRFPLL